MFLTGKNLVFIQLIINLCFTFFDSLCALENEIIYSGMEGAMRYLSEFGYMDEKIDKPHMTMAVMKDSIMDFQEMCSLKQTGQLDSETMKMMNTPRCANRDHVLHPHRTKKRRHFWDRINSSSKSKRYVVHGTKWETSFVTYRVSKYTSQSLVPHQVDQAITRAFQMWEQEINLRFVRSQNQEVDIEILFIDGAHGDNYPFTGDYVNTLAHGFYPGSGLGGDIHFNEAVNWTAGYNLLYTAVHEIGHALGLRHSTDQSAIMFPHYLDFDAAVKLHSDDISGITEIYGRRQGRIPLPPRQPLLPGHPQPLPPRHPLPPAQPQPLPPSRPVAPPAPPQPPTRVATVKPGIPDRESWESVHLRTTTTSRTPITPKVTQVDVAQTTGSEDTDIGQASFHARRLSEFCKGGKLDAMTTLANGDIYAIRGDEILPLKLAGGKFVPGIIRTVSEVFGGKLPPNIDTAFTQSDGKTYFFKGDVYWRSTNNLIDPGYPKKINEDFKSIPNDLEGAFVWSNNQIYFFKGNQYWKFDPRTRQVDPKYPMEINRPGNWEGIPGGIDAVFRSPLGITYFFKTGRYWRFDDKTGSVAISEDPNSPYPRDARIWWFLCTEFRPSTSL